jgi:hypothetical protein
VRRLRKALLHTSLLLLVAIVAIWLYLDRIVAGAVEEGGTRALGVRTQVGGVELALLRGHVGLSGLEIANPEGFTGKRFLRLGSIRLDVHPTALREPTVVIPSLALEDIDLALEGSPRGTNYGRILSNLGSFTGGGSGKPGPAAKSGGGKKFVVRELVVRNVKASMALSGLGSNLANASVEVPEMRLHDLGGAGGMPLPELISQVTASVVQGVMRKQPELTGLAGDALKGGAQKAREELEQLGGVLRRSP